jgi:hypothetical protein
MKSFLKRLVRDRRGNALVIMGAAIPLVVGSAGLATDTIQWATWKRELQRAADSGAYAGVLAKVQGAATANAAVTADFAKNSVSGIALLSGYPQIAYPTSANWTGGVQVTLAVQKRLGFSSMFISAAPTITATATAALVDDGEYCLRTLKKTGGAAISLGGSSNANLGCAALSNSDSNPSVVVNGSSYNFEAPLVAGAGTLPSAINGVDELQPYHIPLPDPFAGKYPTDIPSGTTCKNFNQNNYGPQGTKLKAGCYNDFKLTGNQTYTMDPGVYYLNSTDFDIGGGVTLQGTGVTIILTGSTPGSVKTNGNSGIQISAPESGAYENMLFIQAASATTDNLNEINGNSTSSYDGAMYFPNGNVTFTGSSGNMTKCVMVVSYTATFNGNTNLQNNVTGCKANTTVPGYVIKLVA